METTENILFLNQVSDFFNFSNLSIVTHVNFSAQHSFQSTGVFNKRDVFTDTY